MMILHTERFGSGEPILFLHSGLQTGATDFVYQQKYFTEKYRVIAADLRGHGKSKAADFSNYLEDSAQDVIDTLADLNLDAVHIIGASLGALVGLFVAKRYPDSVKSLTISGVIPKQPDDWAEISAEDAKKRAAFLADEKIVAYFDELHESNWQEILGMSEQENWYPYAETKDLSTLSMPVLYLAGEAHAYEVEGAQIYSGMNEQIHVSIIPFAAHHVHVEQARIYTKIVAEFYKKLGNE